MKKIAVLVDFTRSGKPALQQAKRIAEASNAEIIAVNISDNEISDASLQLKLEEYAQSVLGQSIVCRSVIGHGKLLAGVPELMSEIKPDLIVICTHGIRGVMQNLFGATVLKLVQSLPYPCLVVQENSFVKSTPGFRILLTASPYDSFYTKMKYCAVLAAEIKAEVIHYEMDKYLGDTEQAIADHASEAAEYFAKAGVSFTAVNEELKLMSLGFAPQTINYAAAHSIDMICVTSDSHQDVMAMGKADKEKILTNEAGVPVLCCPDI
jgi:nucleotide-binding universal stress UspA family protein